MPDVAGGVFVLDHLAEFPAPPLIRFVERVLGHLAIDVFEFGPVFAAEQGFLLARLFLLDVNRGQGDADVAGALEGVILLVGGAAPVLR